MATIRLTVPALDTVNATVDLGATLLGLSGVEHVDLDDNAHTVSVEYDPAFADDETISRVIVGSGYPCKDRSR